ncbi:peptidoglycan-binding protein [Paenibacillus lentus]|uniref:Peptidoglycan-binding protein n=1 Tax=Paenibacillus lentus TaxID=1338368 RepID=A0A3Q8SCA6_9BACL|nr:peptidoglycan-binding domain-containing protein [Paenibacillus lentus]AZK47334.1 peptidoglycan-binding protein [Paenibacillus lentus]
MQQYLAEINLYRGEITGKYSPELLRAVERFQDNYNSSELSAELQYKFDEVNGKIDHRVLNLIYMKKDLVEKSPRNLDMCLIPGGLKDTRSVFEKTIYYFNKSIDSFKEIGSDIMVAADERANKALDSPGDFLNYISFGIPKGIYDGYAYRAENRHESAYTYIDWLSSGVLSGVYEPFVGAFNPDDPYSKEHWLDSIGLAAQIVGLGAARMQLKSNSTGSGGSLNANTNVDLNKTKKVETEPKKTNPDPVNNSLDNKGKDELRARVEANIEQSAAAREASRFDEYLKKEKELLEAIEKKNEGMGNGVSRNTIINSATQAKKGGETVVGHALQKHAGRNPEIWGKVKGGSDQINQTAQRHLEEIIDAPGDFVKVTNNRGITFLEKKLPDGRGVRLNQDGTFKGFIDQ